MCECLYGVPGANSLALGRISADPFIPLCVCASVLLRAERWAGVGVSYFCFYFSSSVLLIRCAWMPVTHPLCESGGILRRFTLFPARSCTAVPRNARARACALTHSLYNEMIRDDTLAFRTPVYLPPLQQQCASERSFSTIFFHARTFSVV